MLLLLAPFLVGFSPPGITASDEALAPLRPSDLRKMLAIQRPDLTASAALIMDAATGKVVFEKQSHQRRAPASITKMMTAIVALEKGKLADKITVPRIPLPEESSMGLAWGDVLTLEDLLWGLLLPSGNDAATVIAYSLGGGSMSAFVDMMNQKASQMGLKDTHFVNPHGLDEEGHYSTAYDLA
ncbi:MAG: D-alanyl-D-alanine carboxypeptidase, partial [Dehalococcoidia bacterium]|nr:D-alanyl-D-alanine carboxypeptidase [Dehalococcoidia bacterium]